MTLTLKSVGRRFEVTLDVIEGGTGQVTGVLIETDQTQAPSYVFVPPRRIFRVNTPTVLPLGVVLRSPHGMRYLVGANGPSEQPEGVLWQSYRLYQVTQQVEWRRRTRIKDPITNEDRDGPVESLGLIWATIEPTDREELDRRAHLSAEKARVLTGREILADDILVGENEYEITRVDKVLGLRVGFVTY